MEEDNCRHIPDCGLVNDEVDSLPNSSLLGSIQEEIITYQSNDQNCQAEK